MWKGDLQYTALATKGCKLVATVQSLDVQLGILCFETEGDAQAARW